MSQFFKGSSGQRSAGKHTNILFGFLIAIAGFFPSAVFAFTCTDQPYSSDIPGRALCSKCSSNVTNHKYITVKDRDDYPTVCVNMELPGRVGIHETGGFAAAVPSQYCGTPGDTRYAMIFFKSMDFDFVSYSCIDTYHPDAVWAASECQNSEYNRMGCADDINDATKIKCTYVSQPPVVTMGICQESLRALRTYNTKEWRLTEYPATRSQRECKPGYKFLENNCYTMDSGFGADCTCIPMAGSLDKYMVTNNAAVDNCLTSDETAWAIYLSSREGFECGMLLDAGNNSEYLSCVKSATNMHVRDAVEKCTLQNSTINMCPCMNDKNGTSRCGVNTVGAQQGATSCKMSSAYTFSNTFGDWNFQSDCAYSN